VIRASGLVKRYGAVTAVDRLSFEVEPGETFALIGPNGAGKTTTLKIILGLTRPDEGEVRIGPRGLPPHDASARHDLGYVPQRVEFPPGRTVSELLAFYADLRGLPRGAVAAALARADLLDYATRRASELSGGYTQRLSLAQALLGDPALLVLDEPTASLDPEATWEFRTLLEQLQREGKTVILSSHLLTEVERVADRVLILLEGRPVAVETMSDLKALQLKASRLLVELAGDAEPAAAALRARGLDFESAGPGELLVDASDGQAVAALEALQRAGIHPRSFQVQGPTLEDLFLSVVRGGRR
jgi:ABC-type multidrug transport system ATPase subunit